MFENDGIGSLFRTFEDVEMHMTYRLGDEEENPSRNRTGA